MSRQVHIAFFLFLMSFSIFPVMYGDTHTSSLSENTLREKCEEALSSRDYASVGRYGVFLLQSTEKDTLGIDLIKKEHESELARQNAKTQQTVIALLSILLILSVIVIVLFFRTLKRRKRQYRNLVSQNLRILKENADYETRLASMEPQSKEMSRGLNSDKSMGLFESLQKLMTQDHLFKDPLLTREKIEEEVRYYMPGYHWYLGYESFRYDNNEKIAVSKEEFTYADDFNPESEYETPVEGRH